MSGVKLGGHESDLTIRECGLAINYVSLCPCELCVCLGRAAAGGAGASAGMWLAGWTQRRSHHSTATWVTEVCLLLVINSSLNQNAILYLSRNSNRTQTRSASPTHRNQPTSKELAGTTLKISPVHPTTLDQQHD